MIYNNYYIFTIYLFFMRAITILNNKGGVGKTTTVQNIGAALASFTEGQKKVLLIDLDPQGSLTKSFGIRLQGNAWTSGSFVLRRVSLEQATIPYKKSNIDILPAFGSLLNDEEAIRSAACFPFNLKQALAEDKQQYDFIVIDCPPALSALTQIALIASDRYYIPLQAEYLSYEGLIELIHYANEMTKMSHSVEIGGVFATRFNPKANKKFSKKLIEAASKQLKGKFLTTYIRESGDLYKAQAQGEHIFDYNKASNGAIDYYSLTKEIITKL